MKEKEEEFEKEFYLATLDNINNYLIYKSETFKLSEIDIINLIRICLVEERSKQIGKKILAVYKDSTPNREKLTKERLRKIGIKENEPEKPIRRKTSKTK